MSARSPTLKWVLQGQVNASYSGEVLWLSEGLEGLACPKVRSKVFSLLLNFGFKSLSCLKFLLQMVSNTAGPRKKKDCLANNDNSDLPSLVRSSDRLILSWWERWYDSEPRRSNTEDFQTYVFCRAALLLWHWTWSVGSRGKTRGRKTQKMMTSELMDFIPAIPWTQN